MLLKRGSHDLGLLADLPDTDFTLHATRDDARAVVGWGQSSDTVVVSVVDGIEKTA